MATIVEYNGVTLYNVLTRKWDEEVFYDQTNTDEIGKRYSFTFECVLHKQRVPLSASAVFVASGDTSLDSTVTGTVFDLAGRVRNVLNHPRKTLRIYFGTVSANTLALEIAPSIIVDGALPNNADIDNGPKPKVISLTPIGGNSFRITFTIEATVGTCFNNTRNVNNMVISNRWSLSESMDPDYYVTRRISGQLRLAAGVSGIGVNEGEVQINGFPAHQYKSFIIPPLEGGFKRDGVIFTVSADGLTCTYEVLDKQVHHAAPWPATRMRATHTEGCQNGAFFTSECQVQLVGDAACDKRLLVERVVQILDARLAIQKILNKDDSSFVDQFSITDHIGDEAIIEGYARINRTVSLEESANQIGDFYGALGQVLDLGPLSVAGSAVEGTGYNYQLSRVPSLYGYKATEEPPDYERRPAVLFFLHCYLQDPCGNVHDVGPGEPTPLATEPSHQYRREIETNAIEAAPGTLDYKPTSETLSPETKSSIYTTAEVSSEYRTKTMMVGLPIANLNPAPQSDPRTRQGQRELLLQAIYGPPETPTTRILPLAMPQTYRVHRMNLERIGVMPALPNPALAYEHNGVMAVLKDFQTDVLTPIRSPDGSQQVYRVVAEYWYQLDRVPNYSEPFPVGKNPITNFANFDGKLKHDFTGDFGVAPENTTGPQSG